MYRSDWVGYDLSVNCAAANAANAARFWLSLFTKLGSNLQSLHARWKIGSSNILFRFMYEQHCRSFMLQHNVVFHLHLHLNCHWEFKWSCKASREEEYRRRQTEKTFTWFNGMQSGGHSSFDIFFFKAKRKRQHLFEFLCAREKRDFGELQKTEIQSSRL